MSDGVDVKVDARAFLKKLESLAKPIDKTTAEEVGKQVVKEMKNLIATGVSPIKGVGKFPGYKDPSKYPGKRKPKTPVNLKLTGQMLSQLDYEVKSSDSGYKTEVGYSNKLAAAKETGHREGVNKQPERPTIPQGRESFAERIKVVYEKILQDRIAKLTK